MEFLHNSNFQKFFFPFYLWLGSSFWSLFTLWIKSFFCISQSFSSVRVDQQADLDAAGADASISFFICNLGVLSWTVFSLVPWKKHLHRACVLQLSRGIKSNEAHLVHPWNVGLYFISEGIQLLCALWAVGVHSRWGWLENLLSNLIMDFSHTGWVDTAHDLCKYSWSFQW